MGSSERRRALSGNLVSIREEVSESENSYSNSAPSSLSNTVSIKRGLMNRQVSNTGLISFNRTRPTNDTRIAPSFADLFGKCFKSRSKSKNKNRSKRSRSKRGRKDDK